VLLLERDAARAWAKINFQSVGAANHAQASGDKP